MQDWQDFFNFQMSFGWWTSPIQYGILLFMNGAFQVSLPQPFSDV